MSLGCYSGLHKSKPFSGQIIQDLNYTYDPAGNIVSIDDYANTASQDFEYDAQARLTEAVGNYGTKTFAYDTIGNLTSKDGKTYTYGAGPAGPHAVTSLSDNTTFTYDANGNMATKQLGSVITHYRYDIENRLTKVERDNNADSVIDEVLAQYFYDGDGGRLHVH